MILYLWKIILGKDGNYLFICVCVMLYIKCKFDYRDIVLKMVFNNLILWIKFFIYIYYLEVVDVGVIFESYFN